MCATVPNPRAHEEAARDPGQAPLSEGETLFRTLFDSLPLSAALVDLETQKFLLFNDAAARNLGYTREEFAQLSFFDIDGLYSRQELCHLFANHLARPLAVLETRHRTKSGALREVVLHDHPLNLNGRFAFHCVWYDVTEKKAAEAALLQSERMSSVRRMAATFAHQINNPLEAVVNCLYLAGHTPGLPAEAKEYLEIAEQELYRAARMSPNKPSLYTRNKPKLRWWTCTRSWKR